MKGDYFMKMKKNKNKLPDFSKMSRKEEAEFWDTHSFTDYWDELEDVDVVVELAKPKEETLVLRINKDVKEKLAQAAKNKGVTISTLARALLTEKLRTI